MALIRQANATRIVQEAIVLDLGDIRRQGEELKARAREEAQAIVAAGEQERARLLAGASEQGRREGHSLGLAEGRAEGEAAGKGAALTEFREALARLDTAWTEALSRLENDRDAMLLQARRDVLNLAVAMGELVTTRTIEIKPDVAAAQLEAVLTQLAQPTRLTVRINPLDRPIVEQALPSLKSRLTSAQHVELADDPSLDRGSVIAATAGEGQIDASIRTQLERITGEILPGRAR